ncbi:hypothetical protein Cabys_2870 [Caldithrix abyssi DSM 13497]|uniref:Uncharacterized protein n=1 Tax=Caldithrix abyssi DSM 13497 TaxID=880073 RepID=A0A1J1CC94_CALAY|nr:hypothetical protein Cabys_2870 [Caldithrix abyssi DSM 13497]
MRSQVPEVQQLKLPGQLTTDFYKQINTYNWIGTFSAQSQDTSNLNWLVRDRFQSNLLIPAEGKKKWKDEHTLDGLIYWKRKRFNAGLYFYSWYQSDKQVSLNNQFGNHRLGLFFENTFLQNIKLTPYLGYQNAKNRSHVDWGWDTGGRLHLDRYHFNAYTADLKASANLDFYPERQNREYDVNAYFTSRFSKFSMDSLFVRWNDLSKEYYVADSIEQVTISQRELQNKLYYDLSPTNRLLVQTRLQSREISYFNGRSIFLFENYFRYLHLGRRLNFLLTFRTSDETQDNAGTVTDSRTRQSAFNADLNYYINPKHRLMFNFAYVKSQYDTPDSVVNNDDRDEQRFVFNIRYSWQISPVLTLDLLTYAYLFHQIYIYKERSASNSWNRIYKLNPRLLYQYGAVSNRLSTEVLANYTVYDFDQLFSEPRSFVFRKYIISDSLMIRYYTFQYLGAYARLELEDKGTFFSQEFAQQVLQSYQTEFFTLFLRNTHFLLFKLEVGFTYYRRRQWRHVPIKTLNRTLINKGPYVELSYTLMPRINFLASLSYQQVDDSRLPNTRYLSGKLRLNYYF